MALDGIGVALAAIGAIGPVDALFALVDEEAALGAEEVVEQPDRGIDLRLGGGGRDDERVAEPDIGGGGPEDLLAVDCQRHDGVELALVDAGVGDAGVEVPAGVLKDGPGFAGAACQRLPVRVAHGGVFGVEDAVLEHPVHELDHVAEAGHERAVLILLGVGVVVDGQVGAQPFGPVGGVAGEAVAAGDDRFSAELVFEAEHGVLEVVQVQNGVPVAVPSVLDDAALFDQVGAQLQPRPQLAQAPDLGHAVDVAVGRGHQPFHIGLPGHFGDEVGHLAVVDVVAERDEEPLRAELVGDVHRRAGSVGGQAELHDVRQVARGEGGGDAFAEELARDLAEAEVEAGAVGQQLHRVGLGRDVAEDAFGREHQLEHQFFGLGGHLLGWHTTHGQHAQNDEQTQG